MFNRKEKLRATIIGVQDACVCVCVNVCVYMDQLNNMEHL